MQQGRREPLDLALEPLQMNISLIPQLSRSEPAQGRRQLSERRAADVARGLAQRPQSLGESRDVGDCNGPPETADNLLCIGAECLDQVAEKSFLATQLAERLDAPRIDDGSWLGREPRMRGDRGDPVVERCRAIGSGGGLAGPFPLRLRLDGDFGQ